MRSFFQHGIIESHCSQQTFGAIIAQGEEILTESYSTYAHQVGETVIFDLKLAHKFKRAVNVQNLNQVLEELNYYQTRSENRHSEAGQDKICELKVKAYFLLENQTTTPKLSYSAKASLQRLQA